jgi:hypothetical protein
VPYWNYILGLFGPKDRYFRHGTLEEIKQGLHQCSGMPKHIVNLHYSAISTLQVSFSNSRSDWDESLNAAEQFPHLSALGLTPHAERSQ